MKKVILFFILNLVCFANAQITKQDKFHDLTEVDFQALKKFLLSKNLEVRDTIFIKYDYNRESCWNFLDTQNDDRIKNVMTLFQKNISDFNKNHPGAVAFNFREPGKAINKLKLRDETIIIDDELVLKKLIFSKKMECGNSAIIFDDGSYILRFSDPHFDLLPATKNSSRP